ncbi:hypothetical protein DKX38_003471 [Salix brachista]|uniref:40S ribosomal protein S30 n=1 Tax=Salix brachista TaxID=2182728 RepID=A0A5N5NRR1_9ROSI|nr:hypothetical protein DKX38_003471 [Salix brachista]
MILVSLCFCALLQSLFTRLKPTNRHSLPPGPTAIPIISSLSWLLKSFSELEPILRSLRAKYGPVVTLHIGSRPAIFIATHSLAHQALVQNGAVFADRPPPFATSKVISCNQHNISSASYGPTWRLLRRNLTSEILHPSRVKSYSHARRWVLDILINSLKPMSTSDQRVRVKDHIQYAMFCLLVLMCFGDKLEENKIKQVEEVQRIMLLSFGRFNLLNFWPSLTKILFRKRWEELFRLRRRQESVLVPLIRARKSAKQESLSKDREEFVVSYVDTLLDLELPDEKRKLEEGEIVSLCSEEAGVYSGDEESIRSPFSCEFRDSFPQLKLKEIGELSSGKVHGSLARAGKVRGQTPKVAKQDKKKKPRGRAHKRMQYNRRFVTAVVGFGKKRGPNSSEK